MARRRSRDWPRFDSLYSTYPLFFWRKCVKCKIEFRMEQGWRALVGGPPVGTWVYACGYCLPTREAADEFFLAGGWSAFSRSQPTSYFSRALCCPIEFILPCLKIDSNYSLLTHFAWCGKLPVLL